MKTSIFAVSFTALLGVGAVHSAPAATVARSSGAPFEQASKSSQRAVALLGSRAAHDFNGDGKSDLFWRSYPFGGFWSGAQFMDLMDGPLKVGWASFNAPANDSRSAIGDFDGDGKADLIYIPSLQADPFRYPTIEIWLMNGSTRRSTTIITPMQPAFHHIAAVGDFDGDGKSDLIWRDEQIWFNPAGSRLPTGDTILWFMDGTTLRSSHFLITIAPTWRIAGTGDFDGDGKSDVIWRDSATGDTVMWLMDGATYKSSHYMITIPGSWAIAVTGDFDGDGKSDLVWRDNVTGDTVMWLMDGAAYKSSHYLITIPSQWVLAAGDFDGDGKSDLIWNDNSQGSVVMWLMNGPVYTNYHITEQSYLWCLVFDPMW